MMKNNLVYFYFIAIITLSGVYMKEILDKKTIENTKGPGFAISGAGGRIAQHLALTEALIKGLYPGNIPIRPSFLSGSSSGAITTVALNAILESEETGNKNFTWELYKTLLFSIDNSYVFDNSWEGIAKIFTFNIYEGYFLDNSPLAKFLEKYLNSVGYKTLGDLYLPTSISVVNQSSGENIRLWSDDPKYSNLSLLEVLLASASLPLAFPPRKINGLGDTLWIDGGTGIDTIPIYPLLNKPGVTELYIICYGSALTSGGADLPWELEGISLLKNALAVIDDMRVSFYEGTISIAKESSIPSFLYIPSLNESFSALDFDQEKLEYDLVHDWTLKNRPIMLIS